MESLVRVKVGENVYPLQKMNPMEGMEYGMKVLAAVSPSFAGIYEAVKDGGEYEKVFFELSKTLQQSDFTPLLKTAYGQCFTPQNESLADEVIFNRWFRDNPGDMFHLGALAVWELAKDFFPSQLVTMLSGLSSKMKESSPGIQ